MDKTWLWKKKSSEKTIVSVNNSSFSSNGIDQQAHKEQKVATGNEVGLHIVERNLNEKLASVIIDRHGKDDFLVQPAKSAQEAIADPINDEEKAKAEVEKLKMELDKAMKEGDAARETLINAEAALEQCMHQLSLLQEQERKINDVLIKSKNECEKEKKRTEEKLRETSRRVASLAVENTNLSKALLVKEKLVDDLHIRASQSNELLKRLESAEKENSIVNYEYHMLEKELDACNVELEYHRRSVDASQRQQLDNMNKIEMLEAECERLRSLLRRKHLGPVKKSEDWKRKPIPASTGKDLVLAENTIEISVEKINFLIDRLCNVEEENRTLKEIMNKKNAELQSSRIMFSRTASRLSQVEAQLTGYCGSQRSMDLAKYSPQKKNAIEVPEMKLMDDFVEMEKLAIVSTQAVPGRDHRPALGNELVPVSPGHHDSGCSDNEPFDWIQEVLNAIFKHQRISKQNLTELVEDIKIALGFVDCTNLQEANDASKAISNSVVFANMKEENERLKDELKNMESKNKDIESKLKNSGQSVGSLREELEVLRESKSIIEEQMENQKSINEDLDTQLTVTKAKLNEVVQKLSALEIELDDKAICCEELEATCLELQLELESMANKGTPNYSHINDNGNHAPKGWELRAASVRLTECQETILNLGKQLKALASPQEAALLDKVFAATSGTTDPVHKKNLYRHISLRDQMIAEDNAKAIILRSPSSIEQHNQSLDQQSNNALALVPAGATHPLDNNHTTPTTKVKSPERGGALAIVARNKLGGIGFFRRLLMRRKNGSNRRSRFSTAKKV